MATKPARIYELTLRLSLAVLPTGGLWLSDVTGVCTELVPKAAAKKRAAAKRKR